MDGIGLFHAFLQVHQTQLQISGVPRIFWEGLYKKLKDHVFDSGLVFQLTRIDYEGTEKSPKDPVWKLFVSEEDGLSMQDPYNIYLVDHAWTYDANHARRDLSQIPGLLDRMYDLMGGDDDKTEDEKMKFVLSEMWRYNQSYSLGNAETIEDRMPVWYIMDELGSGINHSDRSNFRTVPFLYMSEGVTYTLLFPIKDVDFQDEVTRDFVEGQTNDADKRRALLLPWIDDTFVEESFVQVEPNKDYFLAGHIEESLPERINPEVLRRPINMRLKVFSQYTFVNDYLTDPSFEIVDNEEEADILWLTTHFKDYNGLSVRSPRVFVNQFPFENVLTVKDLLSIVCRRKAVEKQYDFETLETYPVWLPTTFNLSTDLVKFVSYFEQRESKGLDNHWICKPWNLARGLDTHITNNLFHILRLPATGPKIAQKYIANPVLYTRPDVENVKFDIRYIVLLKSVEPLRAYAYSNFFLRFANKEFGLNNFDVFEQHFTVMNYSEDTTLCHVKCADFIVEWERQYPDFPWKEYVEPKILRILREVLEAATSAEPPKGIADSAQSRAVYAADLMLEWKKGDMQPVLLEINFTPDCERACEYYPDFYNDIFECLFLNVENPDVFHDLHSKP